MIPRVAWIPWSGPEMSWLRSRGVETFAEQNPDWEVHVVDLPEDIAAHNLLPAQKADWHCWRLLSERGGFTLDTDIIHVRPIPEKWLEADICAQYTSSGNIYQKAAVGAVAGNELFAIADRRCEEAAAKLSREQHPVGIGELAMHHPGYQTFGVNMLRPITGGNIDKFGVCRRYSHEAFCYFGWTTGTREVWLSADVDLPSTVKGVHWYGGSESSSMYESGASSTGGSFIERLASGE